MTRYLRKKLIKVHFKQSNRVEWFLGVKNLFDNHTEKEIGSKPTVIRSRLAYHRGTYENDLIRIEQLTTREVLESVLPQDAVKIIFNE